MHVRMQSQENVEISNPMYLREEVDEDAESLDPTSVLASNKVRRANVTSFSLMSFFNLICVKLGNKFRQPCL